MSLPPDGGPGAIQGRPRRQVRDSHCEDIETKGDTFAKGLYYRRKTMIGLEKSVVKRGIDSMSLAAALDVFSYV